MSRSWLGGITFSGLEPLDLLAEMLWLESNRTDPRLGVAKASALGLTSPDRMSNFWS